MEKTSLGSYEERVAAKKEEISDTAGVLSTFIGGAAVTYGEICRSLLVNPTFNDNRVPTLEELESSTRFLQHVTPMVLQVMQNLGDVMEGYMLSGIVYTAATYFECSNKTKVGLSMLIASGVVTAAEVGVIKAGTPDILDIAPGVAGGALAIAMFHGGRILARSGMEFNEKHDIGQKISAKIETFDQKTGLVTLIRPLLSKLNVGTGLLHAMTDEEIQEDLNRRQQQRDLLKQEMAEEQQLWEEEIARRQKRWANFDEKTGLVTKFKPFLDRINALINSG